MSQKKFRTIKSLFGIIIFSSALIFNISFAQAAYSADTLVSMTNSARGQNGLGALSVNSALSAAAYAKAQDILEQDYFAHNSPDGRTPWDFITGAGYTYAYAGENLAIGYSDASELFSAWMNSATHRENILNSSFREIGIAVVSGDYQGTETFVAVQEFGATAESVSPEQVASENAAPESTSAPASESNIAPTPTSDQASQGFNFIREKSDFSPKSIFAGEEITFKVTISGEVKTLEVQVFEQKFNLLETGSITGDQEKTYTLKGKIENEGTSEVKIVAVDKNGHTETLSLGNLEAKKTVIVKDESEVQKTGLIAGFSENFKRNWVFYVLGLLALAMGIGLFVFSRKTKFQNLAASWRF